MPRLRDWPGESLDWLVSDDTWLDGRRTRGIRRTCRVLNPGRLFVSNDRRAVDDTRKHTRLTQDEVAHGFKIFKGIGRSDLLGIRALHLCHDESLALACMRQGRSGMG